MAVNWNAFLTDEGLTLPDEQWSDFQQISSTDHLQYSHQMPKPTPPRKQPAEGGDLTTTGFDPLFSGQNFGDSLFNPNDYFLSDLEILQPFGDTLAGETTSESSPEPTSGISLTGPFTQTDISSSSQTPASSSSAGFDQSPQMGNLQQQQQQQRQDQQRPNASRAQTFPNPAYESMFPHSLEPGFVEELSFPNGPNGNAASSNPNEKSFNEKNFNDDTTTKRSKNKPDILSACWTSPLCPNHGTDGPPPNPSNCGGGCAPFLFAPDDNLRTPTINNPINEPQEVIAEDGIVEIQPRPKKRSESTSDDEPTGRQFPNPNASSNSNPSTNTSTPNDTRLKTETSEEPSPQQQSAGAEDSKAKPRRRLPHNQVERKYRESLNTQLESLRRVVPALQQNNRTACDGADIEDLPAPSKPSKAVILASATAHIKQLEKENKTVQEENQMLRTRIKALQALVKCEDCSLMQYVMDLKINPGAGGVGGAPQMVAPQGKCA